MRAGYGGGDLANEVLRAATAACGREDERSGAPTHEGGLAASPACIDGNARTTRIISLNERLVSASAARRAEILEALVA